MSNLSEAAKTCLPPTKRLYKLDGKVSGTYGDCKDWGHDYSHLIREALEPILIKWAKDGFLARDFPVICQDVIDMDACMLSSYININEITSKDRK